ncbi:endonuclease/exonuclease/phosphatase family protein [Streptomyces sp. DSM 44917]|uniref:Endonuclease/exonuclease/phosphatase family protein n=1 Tax=Streptomyces boetiae TaxID=3075541 RepID=A0ABU2L1B3_9ACTN|nr:endonuclease/exonuclease/phosphatase family protein [Streptomyces sp. DSM 44917]MDT0305354.1 endonuclease/exonuclease/phosphatase family protein [Streptomyces sp. DSM 44917]
MTSVFPAAVALAGLVLLDLLRGAAAAGSPAAIPLALAAAAGAGPLVWWLGARRAVPAALGALAAVRLLTQLPVARTAPVLALAAGVALAALLLTVRRLAATSGNGPGRAARALALAVAADVALRLVTDLRGPLWLGGAAGWAAALALTGLLAAAALRADRVPPPAGPAGGAELALLGAAVGLWAWLLASPGWLGAQAGLSVQAAGLWAAAGALLGVAALSLPQPAWAAPGALLLAAVAFPALPAAAFALGLAALPAALRAALRVPRLTTGRGALADLALAGAGAGLACALPALAPRAGGLVAVLALAGAAGYAALAAGPGAGNAALPPLRHAYRPVLAATVLLALPPLAGALRAAPDPLPTDTAGGTYRVLTWNVHGALDRGGEPSAAAVVDVIRGSQANVVLLQEVPRGWTGSGGLDLAAWLERRVDATAVWAEGGSPQTGNLLLTSLPVVDRANGGLPHGRSYASATVRLTDGETSRVTTTHLDGAEDPGARLAQLGPLLRAVGPDRAAVLAGDLNARPGSPETREVTAAGLRSAQDEIGDPDRDTALAPPRRVDWILGAPGVSFGEFEILDSDASDHLPLAVTVYLD